MSINSDIKVFFRSLNKCCFFFFLAYRRASDTFADPRTRPFNARSGRNVHFAEDNSDTGNDRRINIVRDDNTTGIEVDKEKGKW